MADFLAGWYLWLKAFHVIFVITWMAGLFYLPRLFVYHCRVKAGSEQDKMFQVMERKLLRVIMNPAMILVWILGIVLIFTIGTGVFFGEAWGWVKLTAVSLLTWFHHALVRYMKDFAAGKNTRKEAYYRRINEIPAVLLVIIVIMVIVRPF